MRKIKIKPLSVNDAWQGRRFKTDAYKNYELALSLLLPRRDQVIIPKGKLEVFYRFGFSSSASDWDNCIKNFQDCIAKRYGFNDKMIFRGIVEKEIVARGCEYIEFGIREYTKT